MTNATTLIPPEIPGRTTAGFPFGTITAAPEALTAVAAIAAVITVLVVTALMTRRRASDPPRENGRGPSVFVWAVAAAYFLFFAFTTVARHYAMATNGYDLGWFANVVWQFGHGFFFQQSLIVGFGGYSVNVTPILALLGPLARVFKDPAYLLVLQAAAAAGGVPLIYAVAKKDAAASWPAALFAAAFALSPALHGANFCEFHPRVFAIPFGLASFYFYSRKRYGLGVLFNVLVASCQEDLAMHAVGLALFGALAATKQGWRFLVVGAFAAYFAGFAVILYPKLTYAPAGGQYYNDVFAPADFLRAPAVVKAIAFAAKLAYVAVIVVPVAVFIRRAGPAWVTLITPLATPLLATKARVFGIWWHYPLSILPFVYGAAAVGFYYAAKSGVPKTPRFLRSSSWAAVAAQVAIIAVFAKPHYGPTLKTVVPDAYAASLAAAYELVPDGVPVSADDPFVPHLAHRRYCYLFPANVGLPHPAKPAALLVARRSHGRADIPLILDAAAGWGLRLSSFNGDYAYFDAYGTEDVASFRSSWLGSIEEWECTPFRRLSAAPGRFVSDEGARDGRAVVVKRILRYRSNPDALYAAGTYDFTFFVRAAAERTTDARITVLTNEGGRHAETGGVVSIEPGPVYTAAVVSASFQTPFSLSFEVESPSPFVFDGVAVDNVR